MVDNKQNTYIIQFTFLTATAKCASDQKFHQSTTENHEHHQAASDSDRYHSKLQPKVRKKTDEGTRKRNKTIKYERMYELWETVKKRYRDQQIKMYQNKILLQQQLIKRQAEILQERRSRNEAERRQNTIETAQLEKNNIDKLRNICSESLVRDKLLKRSGISRNLSINKPSRTLKSNNNNDETAQVSIMVEKEKHDISKDCLIDIAENHNNSATISSIIDQDSPEYQLQLVELFGESDAKSILFPSFKPIVKKGDNLLLQKFKEASASISDIWYTLRGESISDKTVKKFQSLPTSKEMPAANFATYKKVDLSESSRNIKNKVNLMYRVAKQNEDLTSIMMHNNQTAEFLEDGITADDWFTRYQDNGYHYNSSNQPDPKIRTSDTYNNDINLTRTGISSTKLKSNITKQQNSDKISIIDNKKLVFVSPKLSDFLDKSFKASRAVVNDVNRKVTKMEYETNSRPLIPIKAKSGNASKWKSSSWEPLSPNALAEYSVSRDAPGKGHFSHGRHSMWSLS
ncbi:uncharacterized protein TRIADDRAFT_52467 [Trichoplax adhaerens]|uniref:Uncharacterized protein n=1 Tax=Trichoplax adhaerens TaxID=10228 RepID=B3RIN2_TRIAD|nr:hypothetical protein TRIADDRAFT_52467 [Trichoplax adhaerens]EDV29748.1 hypothetical protein TRIADDRAFT_52467 [Trichoplax adhaerens]|eukprot:XP_002108950.1 hypothetical protein TRIADDRAFT_52467 [Trichoplax adhaerens]